MTAQSLLKVVFGFFILTSISNADETTSTADPYYDLIYDFETAQFCGLVNKRVHDAFWSKRKAIEDQSKRSTEQLRKTRIHAMAAADLEYANRGLGGYKPWCEKEGRAGIKRITTQ